MENTTFTTRTDHDFFNRILNVTDSSGRLRCWRLGLSEYEFNVIHRARVKRQAAGALSRLPTTEKDLTSLNDDLPLPALDVTKI